MTSAHQERKKQYLTFRFGEESFAIAIAKVREVMDYTCITMVPGAPDFVRGIINLRGNIISVIDLRTALGMKSIAITEETGIIIMEIEMDNGLVHVGVLVDEVQAVVGIPDDQVFPPPSIGTSLNSKFVQGIGKSDDVFRIILDIDRIIETAERLIAAEAAGQLKPEETMERTATA